MSTSKFAERVTAQNENTMQAFLVYCCEEHKGFSVTLEEAYRYYRIYCETFDKHRVGQGHFTHLLRMAGLESDVGRIQGMYCRSASLTQLALERERQYEKDSTVVFDDEDLDEE